MDKRYSPLDWQTFGRLLILSGDLDPVYIMLSRTAQSPQYLKRWIIAYMGCYHAGVATYICAGGETRDVERILEASSKGWPRGQERVKSFGKDSAKRFIDYLISVHVGKTELLFDHIFRKPVMEYGGVLDYAQQVPTYGPWVAWKLADMAERMGLVKLDFGLKPWDWFYEASQKGAEEIRASIPSLLAPTGDGIYRRVLAEFEGMLAPPLYERCVGWQEVETVLCKFKSHVNGRYPLGKDTKEVLHSLGDKHEWACLETRVMRAALLPLYNPNLELWS